MMLDAFGCLGLPTLDALQALCLKPVSSFREVGLFGVCSCLFHFQNLTEVVEENRERNEVDFVSEDESAKVS